MQTHLSWPSIAITCGLAVTMVALLWNKRKSLTFSKESRSDWQESEEKNKTNELESNKINLTADTIPELTKPRWVKVGQVKELYIYPLKSGKGQDVKECEFTEYGISVKNKDRFTLQDRIFLVYNENTKHYQNAKKYPSLLLVNLTSIDKFKVKLEAVGMPDLVFSIDEKMMKNNKIVECTLIMSEPMKCIDCGMEPAKWLSKFLTNTNSGLRLGYATTERRSILNGTWERLTKVYNTMRTKDMGLFADLASYMLMTSQSLDELNRRLEKPVTCLQFRPNIVISTRDPFTEDKWEWIKIGNTVIRNFKPCKRCKMITFNPETGVAHEEREPLKTLQTFREQTDPKRISVDGKSPLMGIYCGLYVPGHVRIGEDVFVHIPEDVLELNNEEEIINNGSQAI